MQGWTVLDGVIEPARRAPTVEALFEAAAAALRGAIAFDASAWVATDPATCLPTAPMLLDGVDGGAVARAWLLELRGGDVNAFARLARSAAPAGALALATGGRPDRSARHRTVFAHCGFGDELRLAARAGGPWAAVSLWRRNGRPAFDAADAALAADLARPLAEALRGHFRPAPHEDAPPQAGGVLLFDADGGLLAASDDALALLGELAPQPCDLVVRRVRVPLGIAGAAARAGSSDTVHARTRIRSLRRQWIACHASCLRDGGRIVGTAVVVEPAGAAEAAELAVLACGLSPRERQITGLIAQGMQTGEIARALSLSAHTVRGYVKAIFEKVGVSSRGELVARIWNEAAAPGS